MQLYENMQLCNMQLKKLYGTYATLHNFMQYATLCNNATYATNLQQFCMKLYANMKLYATMKLDATMKHETYAT